MPEDLEQLLRRRQQELASLMPEQSWWERVADRLRYVDWMGAFIASLLWFGGILCALIPVLALADVLGWL